MEKNNAEFIEANKALLENNDQDTDDTIPDPDIGLAYKKLQKSGLGYLRKRVN